MANEELRIWGIHTTDDQLGDKYRKMTPLKMVYIPIPEEE